MVKLARLPLLSVCCYESKFETAFKDSFLWDERDQMKLYGWKSVKMISVKWKNDKQMKPVLDSQRTYQLSP